MDKCLDDKNLQDLIDDKLKENRKAEFNLHISLCDDCYERYMKARSDVPSFFCRPIRIDNDEMSK